MCVKCVQWGTMADKIWLSMHPRNLGCDKIRPSVCPPIHVSGCGYYVTLTICVSIDIGHPCYGQLAAVKIRYQLTSIT